MGFERRGSGIRMSKFGFWKHQHRGLKRHNWWLGTPLAVLWMTWFGDSNNQIWFLKTPKPGFETPHMVIQDTTTCVLNDLGQGLELPPLMFWNTRSRVLKHSAVVFGDTTVVVQITVVWFFETLFLMPPSCLVNVVFRNTKNGCSPGITTFGVSNA